MAPYSDAPKVPNVRKVKYHYFAATKIERHDFRNKVGSKLSFRISSKLDNKTKGTLVQERG